MQWNVGEAVFGWNWGSFPFLWHLSKMFCCSNILCKSHSQPANFDTLFSYSKLFQLLPQALIIVHPNVMFSIHIVDYLIYINKKKTLKCSSNLDKTASSPALDVYSLMSWKAATFWLHISFFFKKSRLHITAQYLVLSWAHMCMNSVIKFF